jgi:hypothetical protein
VVGVLAVVVIAALGIASSGGGHSSHGRASGAFAWLRPARPPAGWKVARIPEGAHLAYPPGWRPIQTDTGTATVALLHDGHRIDGYLNATPKQGTETLPNWSRFRPKHNLGEGDLSVRLNASATGVRFRSGRGSCVIDTYTTSKATYREIACLVSGPRSTAVVVAAAPLVMWSQQERTLQRAVATFVP